ncbi:MAG: 2-oxoglutarate dehydrogenase complex dihydrolipoyllysine-residue succinyltransferase [Alphaproteobacteria bacterium]|nr:2-oxoglutarate dehydrogenase complex dihydrolipoyllysine-residue succinyltransferase [Alphaproteobacteria bacterium]
MTTRIKAPAMGESIAEATVAKWLVAEGAAVAADQLIAELETDKVNLEVTAPAAGTLAKILTPKGATVKVGQVMGEIAEGAAAAAPTAKAESAASNLEKSGPAVQKLAAEMGASPASGSGKDGRVTKADLQASAPVAVATVAAPAAVAPSAPAAPRVLGAREERVPMTRIRKTIAGRLKQAQNTAAMLTTYNEVDLSRINALREQFKVSFEKKHGAKLGYMGFFTKAVVAALQEWPALNAEIDGEDIVYKHHYDIGVAVSSDRGLVVPVLRGADALDIAGIEKGIADFGKRAREGGLKPDELVGATFSITNGGVFGSMLSMPILNYPQVGILGMHGIKDRPVVVEEGGEKKIVIRPMMYVALTYDHRIVDGREAVSFLVKVKECLEEPSRLVLGV